MFVHDGLTPEEASKETNTRWPFLEEHELLTKARIDVPRIYADASLLLDDSGFADGQHLNEKGRAALSAFIGSKLPSP
jgi:hypothetical protein